LREQLDNKQRFGSYDWASAVLSPVFLGEPPDIGRIVARATTQKEPIIRRVQRGMIDEIPHLYGLDLHRYAIVDDELRRAEAYFTRLLADIHDVAGDKEG
jgi:hypothetical protein